MTVVESLRERLTVVERLRERVTVVERLRERLTVVGAVPHPPGDVLPGRSLSGGGEGLVQSVGVEHEAVVEPPRDDVHLEDTHTHAHAHTYTHTHARTHAHRHIYTQT